MKERSTLRKLAREAVIFCLLGTVLAILASFVVLYLDGRDTAISAAKAAVHAEEAELDGSTSKLNFVEVPLTNGMILNVRQCPEQVFDPNKPYEVAVPGADPDFVADKQKDEEENDCRYFVGVLDVSKYDGVLAGVSLGERNQVAIERDYWSAYKTARRGQVLDSVMGSLWTGLFGFPAGFALWFLYRLVRFAILG